jgi:hypothetical protein
MSGGVGDGSEQRIDADRVRREHLATVDERRHWLYLVGVLFGGTVLMILLIGAMAAGG